MTDKEAFDATRTLAEGDNVKPWHLYYPMAHMDYYQENQGSFVGRVTFTALGSVVTRRYYCRWKAGWNPCFALARALQDDMDQVANPIHRAVQIAGSVGLPFAEFPVPRAGGKVQVVHGVEGKIWYVSAGVHRTADTALLEVRKLIQQHDEPGYQVLLADAGD